MGIVFDTKAVRGGGGVGGDKHYKRKPKCPIRISRQPVSKELTHQNIQFLKSLGLKHRTAKAVAKGE